MELDYLSIFKNLNSENIEYLVAGGLAVNLHGIPRMTYDIDLVILLDQNNVRRLLALFEKWGYQPKLPVDPHDLADEKNMKAFNFFNESQPIGEIDVIIDIPISFDHLKENALSFEIKGEKIPVVSIEDLIEMKRNTGRKQDLSDIEHLEKLLER